MTESAYFASAAQRDCFTELGVERYKVVASFDKGTCELCGAMDGRVFKLSDYRVGLAAPPFHPWCRCCICPYFEDMEELGERWARNPDGGMISAMKQQNVTSEYRDSATPGKGAITYDAGYKIGTHRDEIATAEWLLNQFGGDIVLLTESTKAGEKMADYLWNGKLWDLKSPTTEKAANTTIKRGLAQIKANPGGIILNYGNREILMDDLEKVIDKRMQWLSEGSQADIMIVKGGRVIKILRYRR